MAHLSFSDVIKFNPYHDSKGRFSSSNGYASFTFRTKDPAKQRLADAAAAKMRQQAPQAAAVSAQRKKEQIAAISRWTDGGYGGVRAYQRGESGDAQAKADSELLEEYISQSPKFSGEIYRGISTDDPLPLRKGQIIDMGGTSSWSQKRSVADEAIENVNRGNDYCFVSRGVSKAADISMHSESPGEKEILTSKDVKFRIQDIKRDQKTGTWLVSVTEE